MDESYPDLDVESTPDVQATNRLSAMEAPPAVKTLNVARAQHIINKLTSDPSWLADPRTAQAANGVFAAASKVIGMNVQLERVNAQLEASRARNSMARSVGSSLLKLAEGGGEGAKWAAQWYAADDDGKPLYENPKNWSSILGGYEQHTASKDIQPKAMAVTLADGTTVQGVYNPQTGAFVQHKEVPTETEVARKSRLKQLESDAAKFERDYVTANAEYVKSMVGQKTEDDTAKGHKAKADYFRAQQTKKLQEIEQLRGAPTTPAAPTAAPASSKRVRVVGPNGQRGTVVEGEQLPEGWSLE